jgi:lipopolysaccharide biosynthesis regulator YciM
MVLAGQRLLKRGQADAALAIWGPLLVLHPQAGAVVALDFARAALESPQRDTARQQLRSACEAEPGAALLTALLSLEPQAELRRSAWLEQLRKHPSLSAALALLREQASGPLNAAELQALEAALQSAAKPLQRYRCAACGFEAQHYFWQCPGCHGWDSFPPRRLEDA